MTKCNVMCLNCPKTRMSGSFRKSNKYKVVGSIDYIHLFIWSYFSEICAFSRASSRSSFLNS